MHYELVGTDGIEIKSFSPLGMLAVHSLEPPIARLTHVKIDRELEHWFKNNNIILPDKLQASIDEFHRAYKDRYPMGNFYRQLADIYAHLLPENFRSKLRKHTHRFMRDYAGRQSPYTD